MTAELLTGQGMPSREGDLSIESHGMDPIPESARYGSVSRVFTVWFTPNLVPAAFFIGTLVTAEFLKLGFVSGLLAIIVGNVLGSYFVALLSTMGPKLGLAQMPAARLPFGKSIVVPGLLNWLSTIGWDGINSVFGAIAITILVPALPFWAALLIIIAVQALLGIIGYEAIHTFEKWMAIVLGVMFAILTISILGQADTSLADGFTGADQIGAFIGYVAIVASFVLAWSLYASDYSRYLPADADTRKVFWYTFGGMAIASGWLEILGLLVAGAATGGESSDTIYKILGGSGNVVAALAMVAIAIGTIAVNAMNDYTGSLSLQAAGLRIPRVYSAAAVAALGFLFTLFLQYNGDFAGNFINFILFISYWITPFVGVVLADWWLRGRHADARSIVDFASLPSGTVALVALVVGFVVGIPFQNSTLGYNVGGPFNYVTATYLHGADLAYYVGGLVAFAIYWFGARSALRRA
ncbi:MAG: nucleobase:cation symporter, family [Chloroflexota bacterium]|jgi:NCS1 family nucleobase:cation symporter-1|nr:nucleobase:cation symporter, family [Chloroflexota bacterium]